MQYNQLGRNGLRISNLTMGTMTFGGTGNFSKTGHTDLAGAKRQVAMCVDAGINMFDTADIYSSGLSEEILGKALAEQNKEVLVTTKARFRTDDGPNGDGSSRYHLIKACEESLRRLNREHIDLYYLHEWDGLTPLEETLEALTQLVRSGKIRYIGVSNFAAWHLMKAMKVASENNFIAPSCQQIYYSLIGREAEYELLPLAVDQGIGVQVWSPLAGGLLTGKYRRNQSPQQGRQLEHWDEPPIPDKEKFYKIIDLLTDIAQTHHATVAQIALAWTMQKPAISSVIIGARNDEQLQSNLKVSEIHLSQDEMEQLDHISQIPMIYPYWHQYECAAQRLGEADKVLFDPFFKAAARASD